MWVGHLIIMFVGEAFLNDQVLAHYDTVTTTNTNTTIS